MSRDVHCGAGETALPLGSTDDSDSRGGRSGPSRIVRAPRPGLLVFAATLGSVVLALAATAAPPAAAAPGLAPNEPATAVAGRTTLYLEATFTGYLRYVEPGGTPRHEPVTVRHACSGAIVNPDGYAVTASGCVRPDEPELLADARHALGQALVDAERLPADGLAAFVDSLGETARFSGPRPGTKPSSALYAQLGVAQPGLTGTPAIPVTVTRADPAGTGGLALVKLARSGLSAIEVDAGHAPEPDAEAVVLGYSPDAPDSGSTEYRQRARTVAVTPQSGTDRLASADDLEPSFRGGPVVDAIGRLRAILDSDPAVPGGPARHLVPASEVARLLDQSGVQNRLSEVDRAYRDALDAYFAGEFSTAVRRFDALLRLAPSHSSAQTYRDRAQHRLDVDGDAVENSAEWLRYLLSAAAGALVVVAVGRGRRFVTRMAPRR